MLDFLIEGYGSVDFRFQPMPFLIVSAIISNEAFWNHVDYATSTEVEAKTRSKMCSDYKVKLGLDKAIVKPET